MRGRRGQGVAGHRHGRAGDASTCVHGRVREASRLASETMALVESIGDPTLTVGLSFAAIVRQASGRRDGRGAALVADRHRPGRRRPGQGRTSFSVRRWRWRWHRAAPPGGRWAVRGGATTTTRRSPWPAAPTRCRMPSSSAYTYGIAIPGGVLLADDAALRDIEEALRDRRAIE